MKLQQLTIRALFSLAALIGVVATNQAAAQTPPFEAVHFERQQDLQLEGTPEDVFRLFEPSGRQLWAKGFKPEFLFPESGEARPGTVFRTAAHGGTVYTTWVLADHEPEAGRIRYVIFIPQVEAWELEVKCAAGADGGTIATVEYRVTSLSEEANAAVRGFFADRFEDAMSSWQSAINTYLRETAD